LGKGDLLSKAEQRQAFERTKLYEGFRELPYTDGSDGNRELKTVGYGHGVRDSKKERAAKIIGISTEEYLAHDFEVDEKIAERLYFELDLPIAMKQTESLIPGVRSAPVDVKIALIDGSYSSLLQLSRKARGFSAEGKGSRAFNEFLDNKLWRQLRKRKFTPGTSSTMLRQQRTAVALHWMGNQNYTQQKIAELPEKRAKVQGKYVSEALIGAASGSLMVREGARFYHGTPTPRQFLPSQLREGSEAGIGGLKGKYLANDPDVAYEMGKRFGYDADILEYALPKEGVYLHRGAVHSDRWPIGVDELSGKINRSVTDRSVLESIGFDDAVEDILNRRELFTGTDAGYHRDRWHDDRAVDLLDKIRTRLDLDGFARDSDIVLLAEELKELTYTPEGYTRNTMEVLEELGFSGVTSSQGFEVITTPSVKPEPTDVYAAGTKRQRDLVRESTVFFPSAHDGDSVSRVSENFQLPKPERALSPAAIRERDAAPIGRRRKLRFGRRALGPFAGLAAFVGLGGMAQAKDEPYWYPGKVEDIILRSSLRKAADLLGIRPRSSYYGNRLNPDASSFSPAGD